jgi:hypothetical protein
MNLAERPILEKERQPTPIKNSRTEDENRLHTILERSGS